MENIGEKIFNLRKEKGVSQEKLAEALSVARQTVSKWERDIAQPTAENIESLCGFFGVASTYFFDGGEAAAEEKSEPAEQVCAVKTEAKKEPEFRLLKTASVAVGIVLLCLLITACGIAAYIAVSPGSGGEWGKDIHIVNYAGIIYLAVGIIVAAALISLGTLLVSRIIKNRKSKSKTQN